MEIVVGILVFLMLSGFIAAAFMLVRFMWRLIFPPPQRVVRHEVTITRTPPENGNSDMTAEEEGNVHSGPYGYSPNTPYPETQYGSHFDPDAEWNEER